jgi:hypothetical protein
MDARKDLGMQQRHRQAENGLFDKELIDPGDGPKACGAVSRL